MAELLPRRSKRARLAESRNGNTQHMLMAGQLQQPMPGMMMEGYPYMNMNAGMMAMNSGMNVPVMNPCAGMQNMSMSMPKPGMPSPAAVMQGNPRGMMQAQAHAAAMPGFSNAMNVDDDSEEDEEEPDPAAEQHQQQQQLVAGPPSASVSGNEAKAPPPSTGGSSFAAAPKFGCQLVQQRGGRHYHWELFGVEGSSKDTACPKPR